MSSCTSTYRTSAAWVLAPPRSNNYRNARRPHMPSGKSVAISGFKARNNRATRKIDDIVNRLNLLRLHDIVSGNDILLRDALRGDPIATPEAESVFRNVCNALRNAPIERASVTFYDEMFYFAIYLRHNFKLTFSCFTSDNCIDSLICPTASLDGEIVAECQIEFRSLESMLEEIMDGLDKCAENDDRADRFMVG